MSHVLPDYREQISGTPLKYTLINTAPLAQVVVRHYELLSQHWSPDDMATADKIGLGVAGVAGAAAIAHATVSAIKHARNKNNTSSENAPEEKK